MADIHIQIINPDEQTFGEVLTFDFADVITVTGFQALMNRWLKTFLTPKGTDPVDKSRGTEFAYLRGSNVSGKLSLQPLLTEYVEDASAQVRAADRKSPKLPPESRLRTAAIIQIVELDKTRVEFWVELTNDAGLRMNVLIPYKVGQ